MAPLLYHVNLNVPSHWFWFQHLCPPLNIYKDQMELEPTEPAERNWDPAEIKMPTTTRIISDSRKSDRGDHFIHFYDTAEMLVLGNSTDNSTLSFEMEQSNFCVSLWKHSVINRNPSAAQLILSEGLACMCDEAPSFTVWFHACRNAGLILILLSASKGLQVSTSSALKGISFATWI